MRGQSSSIFSAIEAVSFLTLVYHGREVRSTSGNSGESEGTELGVDGAKRRGPALRAYDTRKGHMHATTYNLDDENFSS